MRKVLAVVVTCCLVLSGCATTGGVRVEGAAAQVTPPPSMPPVPTDVPPSVDAIALLRTDPKVSANIKSLLTPCSYDRYPIDTRYVDVTQDGVLDLVVMVATCESKMPGYDPRTNLAGYVYNLKTTPPTNIFTSEQPWMDIETVDSDVYLELYQFAARDKSCCPSQPAITLYRWNGTALEPIRK